MSILGRYIKQPIEVEFYGIQFVEDMSSTDEIDSAFTIFTREYSEAWDGGIKNSTYTPVLSDNDKTIVTTASVNLPVGLADGFRLNVSNYSQSTGITVGSINVPARSTTIVVLTNGVYKEEAKSNSILVKEVGDQRVRTQVFQGTPYESYKVQVAVSTSEGRTMQNEFIIEIEEE